MGRSNPQSFFHKKNREELEKYPADHLRRQAWQRYGLLLSWEEIEEMNNAVWNGKREDILEILPATDKRPGGIVFGYYWPRAGRVVPLIVSGQYVRTILPKAYFVRDGFIDSYAHKTALLQREPV